MTCQLSALCLDANDPPALARFWGAVLGWGLADATNTLAQSDGLGFRLRFCPTRERRVGRNAMHLDLTSTSPADQQRMVARALEHGGQHLDVGQLPEERHVVLADPEGNEFCIVEPDNQFLAGCGVLGALTCDGSRAAGIFYGEALGWPLVWDQGQQTAIQAPYGGPKIAWDDWSMPRTRQNRLHFELALPADGDPRAETGRLVALGATVVGGGGTGEVVMTDPDGREFCLLRG